MRPRVPTWQAMRARGVQAGLSRGLTLVDSRRLTLVLSRELTLVLPRRPTLVLPRRLTLVLCRGLTLVRLRVRHDDMSRRLRPRMWMFALGLAGVLASGWAFPGSASAHGPVAPVALDYLARVRDLPARLDAKVVDGDQRMWLRAPASETVVVVDYRGAPYLRFSRLGVEVNQNSAMYYLNQTPFAWTPPPGLGPQTPPKWARVSSGHDYGWHDGRLHALATVALNPGASFVGTWRVPILVDGRYSAISGGLWHAPAPSIVWFWPIAVILLCVLAAWRVRRPDLDRLTARVLALGALAAVVIAGLGRQLHGRPSVSAFQLVELAAILAFVGWGFVRVLFRPPGFFSYFVIAIVALWEGLELIPTLTNGFVLIALPAFVARAATVIALGTAAGVLLLVFRLHELRHESPPESGGAEADREGQDEDAWELA
jgi:hypothetical protein